MPAAVEATIKTWYRKGVPHKDSVRDSVGYKSEEGFPCAQVVSVRWK